MPDNTPQIVSITSESLQQRIRNLLPSQQGFGHDLQASNVIFPIIDLTSTAEGSGLPDYLQQAMTFDDMTAFNVTNTATTIVNSTGFWRLSWSGVARENFGCKIEINNGLSSKAFFEIDSPVVGSGLNHTFVFPSYVVLLSQGDSIVVTADANTTIAGSCRQIADINGNLVNPSGYTPQ